MLFCSLPDDVGAKMEPFFPTGANNGARKSASGHAVTHDSAQGGGKERKPGVWGVKCNTRSCIDASIQADASCPVLCPVVRPSLDLLTSPPPRSRCFLQAPSATWRCRSTTTSSSRSVGADGLASVLSVPGESLRI